MPKDTFFNLPEEKRQRIIEAAIDEFATHPFQQARVTAIADQAGIAKGSFYQYFADKKDLYTYLMGLMFQKKISYLNQDLMENRGKYPFFQLLREVFISGIRFAKENPRLVPIGMMLVNDKQLYHEIFGHYEDASIEFFRKMLEEAKDQGEIDPVIDPKLAATMLIGMLYSLTDFLIEDGKLDLDDMAIIDQMLYFAENGLKKKD
ncbi:MAG: TetR/AcrR family transcriptional regulator [Firmicutes bacterium]|nr:TetR/AcrR family transcriptional regulator [Bacillota bacterium]